MQRKSKVDVVVVGGGPAGSTAATLIARRGHKVMLLEKEHFPRYQIGESLLPATVHGVCRLLGVYEEVMNAGFVTKHGGTFRWGKRPDPWTFSFGDNQWFASVGASTALQVERARFDHILLRNAAKAGVEVREGCAVRDVVVAGDRVGGVEAVGEDGQSFTVDAQWVVDASGNTSKINASVGTKIYSEFFQNVALYGYFENGKRMPPPRSGNILCAAFEHGWFWYIPLSPTITSVGAVVAKEHAGAMVDREAAMKKFIDACPLIKDMLAPAQRVTSGLYGELRIRKDYSYTTTKCWRPGIVLVGDAAQFVDPVFSSGVHLATYSGILAARSINARLAGQLDEETLFGEYEYRYRREFGIFYDFLMAFYELNKDQSSYYWRAQSVLRTKEEANEAFVRLVGGGGTAMDDFFGRHDKEADQMEKYFELRAQGKGVEAMSLGVAEGVRPLYLAEGGVEGNHLMSQALNGVALEKPVRPHGLVPTEDGLSWRQLPGA